MSNHKWGLCSQILTAECDSRAFAHVCWLLLPASSGKFQQPAPFSLQNVYMLTCIVCPIVNDRRDLLPEKGSEVLHEIAHGKKCWRSHIQN